MIEDLRNKVVLVTGASTGIGAAVARGFGANGCKVMVHYNSSEGPAHSVADAIVDAGAEADTVQGDVADPKDVRAIIGATVARFGRIDILVNNAGSMLGRKALGEIDDAHYLNVMQLNAWSVLGLTREVAGVMKAQGGGVIINVTSIAARNGGGGGAVLYAASKGFVSTLTRGLSKELWADKIRINAVSPGVIQTPFHERFSSSQQLEAMRQSIPMGRIGTPEDCVGAFLFLASDAMSGYIMGQTIEVNGGQLML